MSSNVTQFFKYETQNLNIYWVRLIYNCSVGKRPKGQGWSLPPPKVYHPVVCIIQREQTSNVNVRRKGRISALTGLYPRPWNSDVSGKLLHPLAHLTKPQAIAFLTLIPLLNKHYIYIYIYIWGHLYIFYINSFRFCWFFFVLRVFFFESAPDFPKLTLLPLSVRARICLATTQSL